MDPAFLLLTLRTDLVAPEEFMDSLDQSFADVEPLVESLASAAGPQDLDSLPRTVEHRRLFRLLFGRRWEQLERQELWNELTRLRRSAPDLRTAVYGALLADARSRVPFSLRQSLQRTVGSLLEKATSEFPELAVVKNMSVSGLMNHISPSLSSHPFRSERTFEFGILRDGVPAAAIVVVFQTVAGGRNQREFLGLLELQSELAEQRIDLVVIADGPGFRSMASVLVEVGVNLRYLTNLAGAEAGELRAMVREIAKEPPQPVVPRDERLFSVIRTGLLSGQSVGPNQLALTPDEASDLALRFVAQHIDLDLDLSKHGTIGARNQPIISTLRNLKANGAAELPRAFPVEDFFRALGWNVSEHPARQGLRIFELVTGDWRLRLPDPTPVFVDTQESRDTAASMNLVRDLLSRGPIVSRVGLLLRPQVENRTSARQVGLGGEDTAQIAVLTASDLAELLLAKQEPANGLFVGKLLEQVDLSLVSPFTSEGPTSPVMFYGREPQLRRVLEHVRHQSFALVGGRRAGKTSLLLGIRRRLPEEVMSRLIDCQAHPTVDDFVEHLLQGAGLAQAQAVNPSFVERAVDLYLQSTFGDELGVLFLDEVDRLFDSDSRDLTHPHQLSNALRSLVQLGRVSIVVTGERQLFRLTRDPSSPHWNFCTPIAVGPIPVAEAVRLLEEPFRDLHITTASPLLGTIVDACARHPNLIQYFGSVLIDQLSSSGAQTRTIDDTLVNEITDSPAFRDRFIRTFWSQATPLEKWLSIQLKRSQPTSVSALSDAITERAHKEFSFSEINTALSYLELYSIAEAASDGFRYTAPAFDRYLGLLKGSELEVELVRMAAP